MIWFIEPDSLTDANIGNAELVRMVNEHFSFEDTPICRRVVCKILKSC
jgi:hypothetical protein